MHRIYISVDTGIEKVKSEVGKASYRESVLQRNSSGALLTFYLRNARKWR